LEFLFENLEFLIYSNPIENLTLFNHFASLTLQSFESYIKIANEKLNNLELFAHLANQFSLIVSLAEPLILRTIILDSQNRSEENSHELISLKASILSNIFHLIEITHGLIIDKDDKIWVLLFL